MEFIHNVVEAFDRYFESVVCVCTYLQWSLPYLFFFKFSVSWMYPEVSMRVVCVCVVCMERFIALFVITLNM